MNEGRTFAFPHCWKELRGTAKFDEGFEAYKATLIGSKSATVIDADGGPACTSSTTRAVRPRGHKSTKADMKRDASAMHLVGTLKDLYAEKEEATDKREERKRREKEEALKNYYDVQKRKLDIDEANARMRAREVELKEKELELIAATRAKEVELKEKEADHMIMTADLTAMDTVKKAWFEKRQKEILDRTN